MVEMVHDRIAAGETTVTSTAAVLRCGKQMEKLPHYNFSWTVSLQKQKLSSEEAMDLSRDRIIFDLDIYIFFCFTDKACNGVTYTGLAGLKGY
jgi:hypothetical protein